MNITTDKPVVINNNKMEFHDWFIAGFAFTGGVATLFSLGRLIMWILRIG